MDFWGYVLIAFLLFTLVETAVCCVLQRGAIATLLGRDAKGSADGKKGDSQQPGDDASNGEELQSFGSPTDGAPGSFRKSMLSAAAAVGNYRPDALTMPRDVADDFVPYSPDVADRPPRRPHSPSSRGQMPDWLQSPGGAFSSDEDGDGHTPSGSPSPVVPTLPQQQLGLSRRPPVTL